MRLFFISVAVCYLGVFADGINVMFAGLNDDNYPVFKTRYEEYMRQGLSAATDVNPFDYEETVRLVRKTGFFEHKSMGPVVAGILAEYVPDSTLLIWGKVENFNVESVRYGLLRARVKGSAAVVINLYSIVDSAFVFTGKIEKKCEIKKPPAWFRRADLVTHISSRDREQITDELSREAARQTISLVSSVVQSINAKSKVAVSDAPQPADTVKQNMSETGEGTIRGDAALVEDSTAVDSIAPESVPEVKSPSEK